MSEIQNRIQDMVLQLFQAFKQLSFDHLVIGDALAVVAGNDNESFLIFHLILNVESWGGSMVPSLAV